MKKEELINKAKKLGIENAEDLSYNDLRKEVKRKEEYNELLLKAEHFGIDEVLPFEELKAKVYEAEKMVELFKEADDLEIDFDPDIDLEELEKKIKEAKIVDFYEAKNGLKYRFKKTAPLKFRYNEKIATQKDWLNDATSMELMIAGNLSYLEILKD